MEYYEVGIYSMPKFSEDKEYKGLHNTSPQAYSNSFLTLRPGDKIILEADLADTIYSNAHPSLEYVHEDEVTEAINGGVMIAGETYHGILPDIKDQETFPPDIASTTGSEPSGDVVEGSPVVEASEESNDPSLSTTSPSPEESQVDASAETLTEKPSTSSGDTAPTTEPKKPRTNKR